MSHYNIIHIVIIIICDYNTENSQIQFISTALVMLLHVKIIYLASESVVTLSFSSLFQFLVFFSALCIQTRCGVHQIPINGYRIYFSTLV